MESIQKHANGKSYAGGRDEYIEENQRQGQTQWEGKVDRAQSVRRLLRITAGKICILVALFSHLSHALSKRRCHWHRPCKVNKRWSDKYPKQRERSL